MPRLAQSRLRVLVIDDDPDICAVMEDALGDAGYEVITRSAIHNDLRRITRLNADALMVDLLLGQQSVSGWDVIRRLKADPWLADVPILVMSADLPTIREHAAEVASMSGIRVLEKALSPRASPHTAS